MLARYNENNFQYTTTDRNGNIYIFPKKQQKTSPRKAEQKEQKLLGLVLVVVGVVGCCIMPEDAGGCLMACGMGIVRMIF